MTITDIFVRAKHRVRSLYPALFVFVEHVTPDGSGYATLIWRHTKNPLFELGLNVHVRSRKITWHTRTWKEHNRFLDEKITHATLSNTQPVITREILKGELSVDA